MPKPAPSPQISVPLPVAVLSSFDPGPQPIVTTTVRGTAAALNTGSTGVYDLLAKGDLEAVKVGSKTLVLWQSVLDFLARAPRWKPGNPLAKTVGATKARRSSRKQQQGQAA
jgi:hypothetical protein